MLATQTARPQQEAELMELVNELFCMAEIFFLHEWEEMQAMEEWQNDWRATYEDLRVGLRMF